MYGDGQQVLERHRFTFPTDWLYAENVSGEWNAFSEIMKRKEGSIQVGVGISHKLLFPSHSV